MKNFLRASEVKVFAQNAHRMGSFAKLQRLEFQQNPLESHFSSTKKCFVGRMVMIQSVIHFPYLLGCLHNQNVYVRRMKNFPRASEVEVFDKNSHILSLKLCQAPEYSMILCESLGIFLWGG